MSTPAAFLELIGQSLLPLLVSSGTPFDLARLARDVWSSWAHDRDAPSRQVDLDALAQFPVRDLPTLVGEIVHRLLPGRPEEVHANLSRYLGVLAPLLRRAGTTGFDHADDLLRWFPSCVPIFREGQRPAGVGDRDLLEPVRISPTVECWLANNPRLPSAPSVLLAFYRERSDAERILDWHRSVEGQTGLVPIEHTLFDLDRPCLQFACKDTTPLQMKSEQRPELFRRIVEIVRDLQKRAPSLSVGAITTSDIVVGAEPALTTLLVLEPASQSQPGADVGQLARLHRQLLGTEQFGDCNDADEILARLGERRGVSPPVSERRGVSPPVSERRGVSPPVSAPPTGGLTPRRSSPRTSSDVWKVLDDLQKTQPERPKMFTGSFGMRFALIPGGKFSMGSALGECGRRDNEGPVHEVLLTRPFYLSITPVTQEQYVKVMGVNPSRFQEAAGGGPEHPVECVSWDDAVAFCARLSDLPAEKEAARAYRLPTEAEWEYACRAGSTTPFHGGDMLSAREASFDGNHPYGDAVRMPTAPRTVKVGSFAANYFGLYDMHGNVWEWCADWYDASYYQNSPRQDPPGPASGVYRVLRGGSWRNQAATCRSAYRNALASNQRQPFIGFRVVLLWEPAS